MDRNDGACFEIGPKKSQRTEDAGSRRHKYAFDFQRSGKIGTVNAAVPPVKDEHTAAWIASFERAYRFYRTRHSCICDTSYAECRVLDRTSELGANRRVARLPRQITVESY